MKKVNLLAVYGSLRRGFHNHIPYLGNDQSKYLGTQKTNPQFTMHHMGGFPAVVPEGNTEITIEVFEVSPDVEWHIDRLEGYPHWYTKVKIDTQWGEAKMYVIPRSPGTPVIESGDWANK